MTQTAQGGRDGSAPRARPTAPPCTVAWGPETRFGVILAQCLVYQKVQERKAAVVPQQGWGASPLDVAPELGSESCPPLGSSLWTARPPSSAAYGGLPRLPGKGAAESPRLEVGGISFNPELISFNILSLGFLV